MASPLLEGMSSRKRRPNWTDQECLLLVQLMQERKDIIRGKCSTGVSIQDKRQAWEEIAQAINTAFPQIQRTVFDCNKKWENLLAKSREEIKRQKRQLGKDEDLAPEQLSKMTQIVLSVMNLSDRLLQDRKDPSIIQFAESQSCDKEENNYATGETSSVKHPLPELWFPAYTASQTAHSEHSEHFEDPSTSPSAHKMSPLTNVPSSLTVHLHSPCATVPTAAPSAQYTTLQERMDLEMSVLRRQEAVLKLQEEYYTLKIKQLKKAIGTDSS
ncbi:uncharacterized protein LOC115359378 [Myripristis murdjan]|uniref:uncharacterized protein LOC115359378 n=1 Tax=Myripristis murdjan TaxID=586833 RepID=UPI0011761F2C|nr:uncharacterized protein LOC115359378 [Myripristis murdjan]XP_029907678.1 uncharacterized protein LOC115359378 [Myripristis murdjan]